jgi:hypothetical protein
VTSRTKIFELDLDALEAWAAARDGEQVIAQVMTGDEAQHLLVEARGQLDYRRHERDETRPGSDRACLSVTAHGPNASWGVTLDERDVEHVALGVAGRDVVVQCDGYCVALIDEAQAAASNLPLATAD